MISHHNKPFPYIPLLTNHLSSSRTHRISPLKPPSFHPSHLTSNRASLQAICMRDVCTSVKASRRRRRLYTRPFIGLVGRECARYRVILGIAPRVGSTGRSRLAYSIHDVDYLKQGGRWTEQVCLFRGWGSRSPVIGTACDFFYWLWDVITNLQNVNKVVTNITYERYTFW